MIHVNNPARNILHQMYEGKREVRYTRNIGDAEAQFYDLKTNLSIIILPPLPQM